MWETHYCIIIALRGLIIIFYQKQAFDFMENKWYGKKRRIYSLKKDE